MANNVSIETAYQQGTGILYPCEWESVHKDTRLNSYVLIIPKHLLNGLNDYVTDRQKNYRDFFSFEMYDARDELVEQEMIQEVYVFYDTKKSGNSFLEDIACLFLLIDKEVRFNLIEKIHRQEVQHREELMLTGYPQVMSDKAHATKLELKGIYKKVVPQSKKIGVLHIVDDYHWYNDSYKDLELFKGFSGGTVCYKSSLYGMNQAITTLEEGENPFKLIYFLKIDYILEYLRNAGCLVYSINRDGSYKLKRLMNSEQTAKNSVSAILLGGSGSGKSSFAKSFTSHGEQLDSVNDGQTTRNNIIYHLQVHEPTPKVEFKLLNKERFLNRMRDIHYRTFLVYLLEVLFGEIIDYTNYNLVEKYILNLYNFLQVFEKEGYFKLGTVDALLNGIEDEKVIVNLEYLLNELFKKIDITQLKVVMQGKKLHSLLTSLPIDVTKQKLADEVDLLWGQGIHQQIIKFMYENLPNQQRETFNLKDYQEDCAKWLIEQSSTKKSFRYFFESEKKDMLTKLIEIDGFFHLDEFSCLGNQEINASNFIENFYLEDSSELEVRSAFNQVYNKIYDELKDELLKFLKLKRVQDVKTVFLTDDIDKKAQESIRLAMQVKNQQSISSLIDTIDVYDSVSHNYSYLFDKLNVKKLKLIDTRGLDHANWDLTTKSIVKKTFYQFYEDEAIKFDNDLTVFYIKKLDSGRPNEIKEIIPIIHEFIPQAAIYTIFTGADIFYKNEFTKLVNINWKNTNNEIPKNIKYLLSENGKKDLLEKIDYNRQTRDNVYITLVNNIVAYTNDIELVNADFDAYLSNYNQIYTLINSIVSKEYSSLGLVPESVINELDCPAIGVEIQSILLQLFKEASITNWEKYHHMTCRAHKKRLFNEYERGNTLGHQGVYNLYWYQLFHEAYVRTILGSKIDRLIGSFTSISNIQKNAIASALISMEQEFLGSAASLKEKEFSKKDAQKSKFRLLLEKIYSPEDRNFLFNDEKHEIKQEITQEENYKYLNKYYNFGSRFEKCIQKENLVVQEFVAHFTLMLKKQLLKDNKAKAYNMMKLNADFLENLYTMEKKYLDKYVLIDSEDISKSDKVNSKKEFYDLLKYFVDQQGFR